MEVNAFSGLTDCLALMQAKLNQASMQMAQLHEQNKALQSERASMVAERDKLRGEVLNLEKKNLEMIAESERIIAELRGKIAEDEELKAHLRAEISRARRANVPDARAASAIGSGAPREAAHA